MNQPDQKARDIIGHLASQLASGWAAFLVAKHIHEVRASKRIDCAHYFFSVVEEACLAYAILGLSKLLVRHDDSVTVEYLLNCSEGKPSIFPGVRREVIADCVSRHRDMLQSMSSTIANVKEQRDRAIAHLDRSHVNKPSAVYTHQPLHYRDVEEAFGLVLGIVNSFAGYLNPSTDIRFDRLAPNVGDDVEYLVGLIERDNAVL